MFLVAKIWHFDVITNGIEENVLLVIYYLRISLQWYRHSGELVLRGVGAWYRI